MCQHHYVVNLSKREFLNPHHLGDGSKLTELAFAPAGTMAALAFLLAASCRDGPRGGGGPRSDSTLFGAWAGDHVALVGSYANPDDLPDYLEADAASVYQRCVDADAGADNGWRNISAPLVPLIRRELTRRPMTRSTDAARPYVPTISGETSGAFGI